jgi:N-acetylglucosaminyldiphosphoundecaprenol N-acetyl-beta-D-mannosaminyltransferase
MNLLGINFYKGTYSECLETLKNGKVSKLVVTPNPEMLYDASRDVELLNVLKNADVALPDGAGIFVAYQLQEKKYHNFVLCTLYFVLSCIRAIIHNSSFVKKYGERITGSRLTGDLIKHAVEMKIPVTIIDPEVTGDSSWDRAKKASQATMKETLEKKFPWIILQVIIADSTEWMKEWSNEEMNNWIIFATHGNGKQEKLLAELVRKYPQCRLCIGVGGSIDLLTGFRAPAPKFFQRFGGEWLYRLIKNPARHWKRMKKVITFLFSLI